ncbi:hypothetical protein ACFL6X_08695 [Candidatus Latescibacterota bacterium]
MSQAIFAALLVVLGAPEHGFGHGVTHEAFDVGAGIKATYSDGTPMAYCDVTVFAPDDPDSEFQIGSTDPNGCFAFVPDTTGDWRLTVDDGMGHLLAAEIRVGLGGVESVGGQPGGDRLSSVVVGISVVFGLFGAATLLLRRLRPDSPP